VNSPNRRGINKVFVTATTNGVLLLRTAKPYSTDDTFTNSFQAKLRDDEAYASELNIQKVHKHRES
jgi:hypothetical protein